MKIAIAPRKGEQIPLHGIAIGGSKYLGTTYMASMLGLIRLIIRIELEYGM